MRFRVVMPQAVVAFSVAFLMLAASTSQARAEPADRVWFAGVFRGTEDIALGDESSNPVTTFVLGREVTDWVAVTLDFSSRKIEWVEIIACPGSCPPVPSPRGKVGMESFALMVRPKWQFSDRMAAEGLLGLMRWTRDATPFRSELEGTDSVRGGALSWRLTGRWVVSIEYRQASLHAPRTYFPSEIESKSIGILYRF